jgi:hypothetical protein
MTTITTPEGTTPTATETIRLRATWLCALPDDERNALDGIPLREVDARFAAWLDGWDAVGEHGGG